MPKNETRVPASRYGGSNHAVAATRATWLLRPAAGIPSGVRADDATQCRESSGCVWTHPRSSFLAFVIPGIGHWTLNIGHWAFAFGRPCIPAGRRYHVGTGFRLPFFQGLVFRDQAACSDTRFDRQHRPADAGGDRLAAGPVGLRAGGGEQLACWPSRRGPSGPRRSRRPRRTSPTRSGRPCRKAASLRRARRDGRAGPRHPPRRGAQRRGGHGRAGADAGGHRVRGRPGDRQQGNAGDGRGDRHARRGGRRRARAAGGQRALGHLPVPGRRAATGMSAASSSPPAWRGACATGPADMADATVENAEPPDLADGAEDHHRLCHRSTKPRTSSSALAFDMAPEQIDVVCTPSRSFNRAIPRRLGDCADGRAEHDHADGLAPAGRAVRAVRSRRTRPPSAS